MPSSDVEIFNVSDPDLTIPLTGASATALASAVSAQQASNPVNVDLTGAGAVASPGSLQENQMDNWPFGWDIFTIANWTNHWDFYPIKGIVETCNIVVHQGISIFTSAARATTKARMETALAANPDLIIIMHHNLHTINFDLSDAQSNTWFEDLLWANPSEFDEFVLRESASGPIVTRGDNRAKGSAFNWGCSDAVMDLATQELVAQWNDYDGAESLVSFILGVQQDTLDMRRSAYQRTVHDGTITSVTSSTELNIPTWSGVNTDGTPDGSGYESLIIDTNFVSIQTNHQDGSYRAITGHKVINGSTDRVRLQSSLDMSTNPGNEFYCFELSGSGGGTMSYGELTQQEWWDGVSNFMTRIKTAATAKGATIGASGNNTGSEIDKRNGHIPVPMPWANEWEWCHMERSGQTLGFFQTFDAEYYTKFQSPPGGSAGGQTWNPERVMRDIEFQKLILKSNEDSVHGYPHIHLNGQTREPGDKTANTNAKYDALTELDHGFALFFCCLAWCQDNVFPQIEFDAGHDEPIMIDEMIISAGNPITARGFGTYTESGGGNGAGGNPVGSYVFDTPDFGDFGFIKLFAGQSGGRVMIGINIREMTDNTQAWIPHYMPGGQTPNLSLDTMTMPANLPGFKWTAFNPAAYENLTSAKFMGKGPRDFDLNERILQGPILNDGADIGATHIISALEAQIFTEVVV